MVATGDFNGDGKTDLVWRQASTGATVLWLMNGATVTHAYNLGGSTDWSVSATGDFNGDGYTDLIWRQASTGATVLWLMTGASLPTVLSIASLRGSADWSVTLTGDFNADGKTDLVWRQASTGTTVVWFMNGASETSLVSLGGSTDWSAIGAADFNGDGKTDLVWHQASTGTTVTWLLNGATSGSVVESAADDGDSSDWAVTAPGGSISGKAATYTIGGTVIGLKAAGTVHVLNGSDNDAISSNGPFTLPTAVASGTAFNVSVGTLPAGQVCAVQNASGTVANASVTNVLVYCTYVQSVATLNGSYDGAGFNINNDLDLLSIGVPFDGAGNEGNTATLIENTGGTITTTSNSSSSTGRYTVVTTNAIPVLTTGGNNIGAIAGADADEFLWLADGSTADGGGLPALAVGVTPLLNGTMASLAGNWFVAGLEGGSDPSDFEGVLTFGADGSLSGASTGLDENGVVSSNPQSGPAGTITVTSSGQFSDGGSQLGYFSANGEFLVATRTGSGEATGLTVLVKQGANVTLATLNGVYTVGSLAFDSATVGDGRVYTMFFDGAGNWSASFIENDNGTITDGEMVSGTYAVSASGVLTLTQANGNVHTGGISADGNLIVAANLTGGGAEEPRIFVGFRQ